MKIIIYVMLFVSTTSFSFASSEFCETTCAEEVRAFRQYSKENVPLAHMALAHVYMLGNGVDVSHSRGIYYLKKAAQLDFPPAHYQLGLYYMYGMYVEQDFKLAEKWMEKASQSDLRDSIVMRNKLESILDGSEPPIEIKQPAAQESIKKETLYDKEGREIERITVSTNMAYSHVVDTLKNLNCSNCRGHRVVFGFVPYILPSTD
ncbi:hypothetical protein A9267_12795 [Shewanella sp. UCD-FRSSP16_17]|uniref:tetratricopeptide repeat protein n=1 Tax=Shewanella sp. UCD-FRSSP16_17 TaxID=1853256 RepID=UPI0007EEF108|nr:tetratricopeptide repeat protein [Shewanella sp. UCD-FRSSP16_17]OBT06776.1 hypothetical protein A9267_12795 [Shewanella sp. UCD-FRSSP16_17]